jgi:predicted RNA-binding Zn ribbon-like protein
MVKSRDPRRAGDSIGLAVDLVNSWDVMARPPELLRDLAALRHLLARSDHHDLSELARDDDLDPVREVRARIRGVFEAAGEAEAVNDLNDVVAGLRAIPRLVRRDGIWVLDHVATTRRDVAGAIAARAATAMLELIRDGGWERIGLCGAAPCCCVYVDRSKNRSRRYCCQLCADRMAHAAYRRRRAGPRVAGNRT